MTSKTSAAGWVVQVTVLAPFAPQKDGARWIGPALRSAPSFKYFNVAIATPAKAIEATTKHMAKTNEADGATSVVRELSAAEIAVLKLAAGEVKPA